MSSTVVRSTSFVLHIPLYHCQALVSLGQTDEELLARMKKVKIDPRDVGDIKMGKANGYVLRSEKHGAMLRMSGFPETPETFGILAHEIFHLVHYILYNVVGMKLNNGSQEAFAYLTGYITEQVHRVINNQKNDCTAF